MAHSQHPTPTVRWNTHFGHPADTAPLTASEFEYVLDGDDAVAVAARASVLITTQAVAA
ncbi:MAG TPA: hypothetical protein H9878_16475 [Candidatus Dietzia merdigallinarum]|nr:hypothetical protein [Candidatus Dietzia merdigallinarum]